MATLEEFRALRAQVPAETQKELFTLLKGDPQASFQRMVEITAEQGMTITVDEVKGFLNAMDEESESTTSSSTRLPSLPLLVALTEAGKDQARRTACYANDNPQRLQSSPLLSSS